MRGSAAWPRAAYRTALVLAVTAAGCIPIAHTVTAAPHIEGRVRDAGGTPLAGARVAISTESSDTTCASPAGTATADAEGRFTLAAIRHRYRYRVLIGDHYLWYRLCAGSGSPFGPGFLRVRQSFSPDREWLECVQPAARGAELECTVRTGGPPPR